jgi:hypothetical protein
MSEKLPIFNTVAEEVEFWETHSLADYWDELEDARISVDLRPRQVSPPIATLKRSQSTCPIDHSYLLRTVVDYSGWSQGHLLLLRRVPVLECEEHGHRFFTSTTARQIETVFETDREGKLQPDETMTVPVIIMKQAA